MPDPLHSTAAGIAIGTGIGITGTVFGAQADALLIGLSSAILISFWMPSVDNRLKAACSVGLSSLLAGYGSPVAAAWLASANASLPHGSDLRLLLALAIGIVGPSIIPAIIGAMRRKVEAQS